MYKVQQWNNELDVVPKTIFLSTDIRIIWISSIVTKLVQVYEAKTSQPISVEHG